MFPEQARWIYPLVTALAALIGIVTFVRSARIAGLPRGRALLFFAGVSVAAHLGGRLYMAIETVGIRGLSLGVLLREGYRYPGAVLGVLLAFPLLRALLLPNVPLGRVGDALVPGGMLAFATMRLGCLAIGCCYGVESSLPWALRFPPGSPAATLHERVGLVPLGFASLPVHPLQLYFMLLGLATAGLAFWLERRKSFDGQVLLTALAFHEPGKALLELLRQPDPLVPTGHLILVSTGLAVLGIGGLLARPASSRMRRAAAAAGVLLLLVPSGSWADDGLPAGWTDALARYTLDPYTGREIVLRLDDGQPDRLPPFALLTLADANLRASRPARARTLFDLLATRELGAPWDGLARLGRGWATLATGDEAAAREDFTTLANVVPDLRPTALVLLAFLDAAAGQPGAAEAGFRAAATEPTASPDLRSAAELGRALVPYWAGRFTEAATALDAEARTLPASLVDDARYAAARARWRAGDHEGARAAWQLLSASADGKKRRPAAGSALLDLRPAALLRAATHRYRRLPYLPPDRMVARAVDDDGAALARRALARASAGTVSTRGGSDAREPSTEASRALPPPATALPASGGIPAAPAALAIVLGAVGFAFWRRERRARAARR